MASDDWKRELAEVAFARLSIIVWITVLVAAGALAICVFYPPMHEASGSLVLRSKTAQSSTDSLSDTGERPTTPTENDLVSEQQLLLSGGLIQRTIEKLQSQGHVESVADALGVQKEGWLSAVKVRIKRLMTSEGESTPESLMAGTVERIRRGALRASVVTDSNVIRLRLQGRDSERIERFLDTLMSEYLHYRLEVLHPPDQRLFYRERRDFYSERLKALEAELLAATDAISVTDLEAEIANNIELQTTLLDRHSTLRNSYMDQEQRVAMLAEALEDEDVTHFAFLDNTVLDTLNGELMALTIEEGRLERQFREQSPQLMGLKQNIADARARLRAEVKAIHRDATQRLRTLQAQTKLLEFSMAELKDKTDALQREAMRFRQLSREAELLRVSYESFARRAEEAEISEAVGASESSGDVTVLSRPAFTSRKVFPRVPLVPMLGLLFGVAAGVAIAFIVEYFDHTIRRPTDVSVYTSLPVVGSIRQVSSVGLRRK